MKPLRDQWIKAHKEIKLLVSEISCQLPKILPSAAFNYPLKFSLIEFTLKELSKETQIGFQVLVAKQSSSSHLVLAHSLLNNWKVTEAL